MPADHPLRRLRALLLQARYPAGAERRFLEPLRYNMLFRWCAGLSLDDTVRDTITFTENRPCLMDGAVTGRLLAAVVGQARQHRLLPEQHFGVDGSLIHAWASMGSHRRKQDRTHAGTRTFISKTQTPAA